MVILETEHLKKYYSQRSGFIDSLLGREEPPIQAVDDVTLSLDEQESTAIIGESGCGKSTLLMTLAGFEDPTDGSIRFRGREMSQFTKEDWREFRQTVQIISQDPFSALDPKMTVRESLREPLIVNDISNKEDRIHEALLNVELSPPDRYLDQRPEQLSGGQRQRVSIARALVLDPALILADEPVSMLDVSTQAGVLSTFQRLVEELEVSLLYISHDLSTVSYIADEVNVMYLGRIVERAPTRKLISEPKHPYSQALIEANPVADPTKHRNRTEIEGTPPDPVGLGEGCRFADRCPERMDICDITPEFVPADNNHHVACHLHYDHDVTPSERGSPPGAP